MAPVNEITTVGVLGCGLMGGGIAQSAATAGFPVTVRDLTEAVLVAGRTAIEKSLTRLVEKGKLDPSARDGALERLRFTTDLAELGGSGIVIEAVTEDLDLKNRLWAALDPICPAPTIFASNTSSLPIGAMASASGRPDRFVGLHFFNPVAIMPLVEVVRPVTASGESLERVMTFARRLGKEAIVARDRSGFIVNLLLIPYLLDAVRALEHGVASIPDIDRGMQLGCGHPMGPLALLDFVGLDTAARVAEIMFEEYRESRYAPPPLLRRMVGAGLHGRKSGRGFYDYASDPPIPIDLGL
ncbi:MAG: 3-hydroxybutyryl-CoA dehydrogenase [Gemmatimonadales bacterium]